MSSEIDKIDNIIKDFDSGLVDNIVGNNTLIFKKEETKSAKNSSMEHTKKDEEEALIDNIVDDNTLVLGKEDSENMERVRAERAEKEETRTLIAKKDAQDLVNSAKELYSKSNEDIEYIKFKANADTNSLGKILYQIELTEDAITTVMNAINDGDTNTNLFKCLTDLQKTMMELLKTKNLYLSAIEESFKQLTTDVEMSSAVEVDTEDEATAITAKAKNGRELMKIINEATNKIEEEKQTKQ